jgi:formylmethanofuran dehydrogenase subunit E
MDAFEVLLESSADAHGHLCPGQVVGVRMAMLGCRLIGLDESTRHDQIKKLIVYVEMDRCTADAVAHVTGVKLGRRSLKFMDYGIMAATFVNAYAPEIAEKYQQQLEAYKRMPDSVLFRVQQVDTRQHALNAARSCATGAKSSKTGVHFADPVPRRFILIMPGRSPGRI